MQSTCNRTVSTCLPKYAVTQMLQAKVHTLSIDMHRTDNSIHAESTACSSTVCLPVQTTSVQKKCNRTVPWCYCFVMWPPAIHSRGISSWTKLISNFPCTFGWHTHYSHVVLNHSCHTLLLPRTCCIFYTYSRSHHQVSCIHHVLQDMIIFGGFARPFRIRTNATPSKQLLASTTP